MADVAKETGSPAGVCLMNTQRSSNERAIAGALRSAIDAHGPIDKNLIGSAVKRIVGALHDEELTQLMDGITDRLVEHGVIGRRQVLKAGRAAHEPEATLGVGDGSGSLFVHGSYEAIKRVQSMILELEKLRASQPPSAGLRRWKSVSYCRCGERKGHFELSDEGAWVLASDVIPAPTKEGVGS